MALGNRTCPHCGRVIASNDEYCLHCGIKLVEGQDSFSKPIVTQHIEKESLKTLLLLGLRRIDKLILSIILLESVMLLVMCIGIGAVVDEVPVKITLFSLAFGSLVLNAFLLGLLLFLKGRKIAYQEVSFFENKVQTKQKEEGHVWFFINLLNAKAIGNGISYRFVQDGDNPVVYVRFQGLEQSQINFLKEKAYEVGMKEKGGKGK